MKGSETSKSSPSKARPRRVKVDMKAFADRARSFLQGQYGNRMAPDSVKLVNELRADS